MSQPEERGMPSMGVQWFTTTHWSVVLAARDKDSPGAAEALEKLCRTYWPPLYAYIRREGHDAQQAQDLTQEFFAALIEKEYLGHLRHQRGRFRSFLLTFLNHFLSDQRARAAAQKRGGDRQFVSLDDTSAGEANYLAEAADPSTPAELFERQWAKTVLDQALNRLRREYVSNGKAALFEQLKDLQPSERGAISYSELGQKLGMSEAAIKSAAHRLRCRHAEILREEIAQTVSHPDDIAEEIRYLLAVLAR